MLLSIHDTDMSIQIDEKMTTRMYYAAGFEKPYKAFDCKEKITMCRGFVISEYKYRNGLHSVTASAVTVDVNNKPEYIMRVFHSNREGHDNVYKFIDDIIDSKIIKPLSKIQTQILLASGN